MSNPRFGEVAEQLRRSTVLVRSRTADQRGGSGIIWSSDGLIVTNAHVAGGSQLRGSHARGPQASGAEIEVQLWDGRELPAAVAFRDPRRDLAVVRVDAIGFPEASRSPSHPRPGDAVIAIGNPLGFVGALTTGVIHGIGEVGGLGSRQWIQAAVRLAPGNSGGPLAASDGNVIGINTMVVGRIALAIPIAEVDDLLLGYSPDAWLGVTVHPVRIPGATPGGAGSIRGLLVLEVEPGSPAASASLLVGDILLGADGKPFSSPDDLAAALRFRSAGPLQIEFLRGDYRHLRRVSIRLGDRPPSRSSVAA